MIRLAVAADIPELTAWGRKFHAMSGQPCPFVQEAVEGLLANMIESPAAAVFVGGEGAIGGALMPAYCAPDWVIAVELFWWAEKGGLRLLRAFEAWAEVIGANEVRMTSLAAHPRAGEILARRGYAPSEISHAKVI